MSAFKLLKYLGLLAVAQLAAARRGGHGGRGALSKQMQCGSVAVCGILTLESGLGSGPYQHAKPTVHGLWPQVPPYGTSQCAKPTKSVDSPSKVYPCYSNEDGGTGAQLTFENHEWTKHGECAGAVDVDDYFGQVCQLAAAPLGIMSNQSSFDAMATAVASAGYEIYMVDGLNKQLELSACLNSNGRWVLSATADFETKCGPGGSIGSGVPPAPPSNPPSGPSNQAQQNQPPQTTYPKPRPYKCEPGVRGPACHSDVECADKMGCTRCASSGFCTSVPKQSLHTRVKGWVRPVSYWEGK